MAGDDGGNELQHENIFFDGTLPGPTCDVATHLSATPIAEQKAQAEQLLQYLLADDKQLLALNGDPIARIALIALPSSSKVKVLYGLGVGASGLLNTSPIDGSVLALHGNGNATIGTPTPIMLPTSIMSTSNIKSLSEETFLAKLTSGGNGYRWPLSQERNATEEHTLVQLVPIPAFLVYDGFDKNLDAAEIYERVLSLDDHQQPVFDHLKKFLRALVVQHNQNSTTPALTPETLMQPMPNEARVWANTRFKTYFPTLVGGQQQIQQQQGGGITPEVRELLAHLLPAQAQLFQQQRQEVQEEKKDEAPTTTGMSEQELEVTVLQCTGRPGGDMNSLPAWFSQVAAKGMNDAFKLQIIRKHIMTHEFYEDAEVPLTNALLKMIVKRQWAGTGNHRRPTVATALEGLSIFAMMDIEDDEVAQLNILEDALDTAKVTTVDDLIKTRNAKAKIKIPEAIEEFMRLLKRFANLTYALFSRECPLFQAVKSIIDSLRSYSPSARQALSLQTKAAILWIILLQSRQFAMGELDILSEFQAMQRKLAEKERHITHAELPAALLAKPKADSDKADNSSKQNNHTPNKSSQGDPKRIKQNDPNPNQWHPKLKAAMEKAMMASNYPSFTRIMTYCDVDTNTQCVGGPAICTPNMYFGKCTHGLKCIKKHTLPSDAEVETILKQVKKFIDSPSGVASSGK